MQPSFDMQTCAQHKDYWWYWLLFLSNDDTDCYKVSMVLSNKCGIHLVLLVKLPSLLAPEFCCVLLLLQLHLSLCSTWQSDRHTDVNCSSDMNPMTICFSLHVTWLNNLSQRQRHQTSSCCFPDVSYSHPFLNCLWIFCYCLPNTTATIWLYLKYYHLQCNRIVCDTQVEQCVGCPNWSRFSINMSICLWTPHWHK